ncbi:MAG: thermonuclease family protein [Candidatus Moranbacteria bacterium]|nr:thermonuclease family protein [Candidatus Moranbacteria bacterium]
MKRKVGIYIVFGAVMLVVGIGIGLCWGKKIFPGQGALINLQFSSFDRQTDISADRDGRSVGAFKVARVIDGDTIEIEGGERVRYIGMDTPESVTPGKPAECFGKDASEWNAALVEGKMVRLEKDTTDRDQYGRLLRYVYADDIFVNEELVRLGFAYATAYPPDTKYQDRMTVAERYAESNKLGLWSACKGK